MGKASQVLKKKTCGLCSNFDGQKSWEFEGPREEVYAEESAFASSYAVPSTCKTPRAPVAPHAHTMKTHGDFFSKLYRKKECNMRQRIIQYWMSKPCFSEELHNECRAIGVEGCLTKPKQVDVAYRCMHVHDPRRVDWMLRADQGKLSPDEVRTLHDRQIRRIGVPTECELFDL